MYDFSFDPAASPAERWRAIADACAAIVDGEHDPVANMANVAAILWQAVPDLNWAGFYRAQEKMLVLGPFQGKAACIRIPFGRGVCGAAAASGAAQLVADVHAFPGHIACDGDSRSELVVPVMLDSRVIAVIDLDSPSQARFGQDDADGLTLLAARIAGAVAER